MPGFLAMGKNTCDSKPLCPLARKVPQLKGVGRKAIGAVDHDRINKDLLVAIVDKLFKRQKYIKSIHAVLFTDDYPMGSDEAEVLNAEWPKRGCKTLKQIPKGWIAEFFVRRIDGFTSEMLKPMECQHSENIRDVWCCILQLPPGVALPQDVWDDEERAIKLFVRRISQVGTRMTQMIEAGCVGKCLFEMCKYKVFDLEWESEAENAKAKTIVHVPTQNKVKV